jgi:hypothetical protein
MNAKELKKALRGKTGCGIQHNGWPCGTCFFDISEKLTNADWQAVLFKRGDYIRESLDNLQKDIEASLKKTLELAKHKGK